jgi:hypothetical protein
MNTEQQRIPVWRVCVGATARAVNVQVARAGQDSREAELDAALDMTFPASDPVAIDCHAAVARLAPQ